MKNKLKIVLTLLSVYVVYYISNKSQKSKVKSDTTIFEIIKIGRKGFDEGLSIGIAEGDYDDDCDPDLHLANSNGQRNALFRNNGKGRFKKIMAAKDAASKTVFPK